MVSSGGARAHSMGRRWMHERTRSAVAPAAPEVWWDPVVWRSVSRWRRAQALEPSRVGLACHTPEGGRHSAWAEPPSRAAIMAAPPYNPPHLGWDVRAYVPRGGPGVRRVPVELRTATRVGLASCRDRVCSSGSSGIRERSPGGVLAAGRAAVAAAAMIFSARGWVEPILLRSDVATQGDPDGHQDDLESIGRTWDGQVACAGGARLSSPCSSISSSSSASWSTSWRPSRTIF